MKRNYYIVGLVLLTFFVISFLTNIIGPLVPEIIEDFDLSLTLVALLPFAFFIAYGVMSIPSGLLVERYREKTVMMLAFGIAFVGALLLALFPNYLMAVGSLFLIGSGMAMLQVAINPLLREAGGEENFAFNSVLGQLFFGLASFLSPLVYSYLVVNLEQSEEGASGLIAMLDGVVPPDLPWISLYWVFAVVSVAMVVVIGLSRFPRVERAADEKVGALETHLELLRNPAVLLFFLGIFCYVGSEQGVANWISEFLSTYHGYDPQTTGAQTVSWFWGMMTAGTLLGLLALKLFDSRGVLVVFTLGALTALSLALFGSGETALVAFPAIGFFISVMWPVIFSLALNSVAEHHGSFSGILVTGIIGGAVVPLIVGSLGDVFGLRGGMLFLYLTFGYILSVGFWADPIISNKTIDFSGDEEAPERSPQAAASSSASASGTSTMQASSARIASSDAVIGVDIGGTNVRAGLIRRGRVVDVAARALNAQGARDEVLDQVRRTIAELPVQDAHGIGIGVPSVVDTERGIAYDVQNIPSWTEVPLKAYVEDAFGLPVRVNNDANCFAMGEAHYGQGQSCRSLIGLILGTGFAGGVVIDGRSYDGVNCGAGEFGMMPYRESIYEHYCSGQFFERTYETTAKEMHDRAADGDPQARSAFEAFGEHLGNALKAILYAYDPEAIVFGGSVRKAFYLFEDAMQRTLQTFAYTRSLDALKLMVSDEDHIALFGSAALLIDAERGLPQYT